MMHESVLVAHSAWYQFWAALTAAQAHNSGRARKAIDRRVVRFYQDVCELVRPTVSLELGAHEGAFSEWSKRTFPDATCVALEANPFVHAKHQEHLAELGVDYHHLAAGPTNGLMCINIPTTIRGKPRGRENRMASLVTHRQAGGQESIEVPAVRIDDWLDLADHDRLVAWIDVEGASGLVLPGARETLARAKAVYIEVERADRWPGQWLDVDVARFFADIGKVPVIRDIQRPGQYNVVFLDGRLAARRQVARLAATVLTPPGFDHARERTSEASAATISRT
jgi:FkbM family methyltransferase